MKKQNPLTSSSDDHTVRSRLVRTAANRNRAVTATAAHVTSDGSRLEHESNRM
jgi:hypothetical protein